MAGDYYRAKRRTGGFSSALQPLVNFFKEKKQKEESEQWLKGMMNLFGQRDQFSDDSKKVQPSSPQDDNALGMPDNGYFNEEEETDVSNNNLTPKGKSFYPDEDSDVTANGVSYETELNGLATKLKEPVPQTQDNSYGGSTLERPNTPQLGNTNNNLQQGGADQYGQSQDFVEEFMMAIANAPPGADLSRVIPLLGHLQNRSNELKPKDPNYSAISSGSGVLNSLTGKVEGGKEKDVEKDLTIGANGNYYTYNPVTAKLEDTGVPAPAPKGSGSGSNNALNIQKHLLNVEKFKRKTEMEKYEASKGKKDLQSKYNAIMGSAWMDMAELLAQGHKIDAGSEVYDGAYVVEDPEGKYKTQLIFTDEQLDAYAESQVPDVPDMWKRGKKDKEKKLTQSDFISDFEKEVGRKPTEAELERTKREGLWE